MKKVSPSEQQAIVSIKHAVALLFLVLIVACNSAPKKIDETNRFAIKDASGNVVVSTADLKCLSVSKDASGSTIAVFELNGRGTKIFRNFTKTAVNQTISLVLCDRLVHQVVVRQPMRDDKGTQARIEETDVKCIEEYLQVTSCS